MQRGCGGCVGDDDTASRVAFHQPERGIDHLGGTVVEPQAVASSLNATETHGVKVAIALLD